MPQFKKILIIIIVLGLLIGLVGFRSKTANAAAIIYDPLEMLKEFIIKPIVRTIANSLENRLVNKMNSVVSNIDGKSPAFITNWRNHFLDSQGRGNDVFRSVLADTKSCGYFDKNLKTAFGADKFIGSIAGATTENLAGQVVYQNKTTIPGLPSFQQTANCTLPSNFNVNTFRTDFAGGGGWNTWNKLIEPQNNFFGVYSLALGEQQRQMATEEKTTMDSAVAGQGFLSQRLGVDSSDLGPTGCTNQLGVRPPGFVGPMPVVPRCIFMGKEVTPAQILGKSAAGALDKKLGRIGGATELTDILLSLFGAVLNATTNKLTNYIGQATYNRPPSPGTDFSESGIPPTDPNYDAQVNEAQQVEGRAQQLEEGAQQTEERGCVDSCLTRGGCTGADPTCEENCRNECTSTTP